MNPTRGIEVPTVRGHPELVKFESIKADSCRKRIRLVPSLDSVKFRPRRTDDRYDQQGRVPIGQKLPEIRQLLIKLGRRKIAAFSQRRKRTREVVAEIFSQRRRDAK
jgi:hypothetical protein